jgi:hypothetical protein
MILIYTDINSPRLEYAIGIVFKTVLNIPFQITNDISFYTNSLSAKLAYTSINTIQGIRIEPSGLLFEESITKFEPTYTILNNHKLVLFPSQSEDFLRFDVFAFVFYMLTRYEEYQKENYDIHQRYKYEESLVFKMNSIDEPIVNFWIREFYNKLNVVYSDLKTSQRTFNAVSTIDIDNAYAFAHKGLMRNIGGFGKDLLKLNLKQLLIRIQSVLNDQKDPYNTFELIHHLSAKTNFDLKYFVLIGDYSNFDKNPHYKNKAFRKRIKDLSKSFDIGLHPSYLSFNEPERVELELKRLEDIIERKVESARCHFLRINWPNTYQTFLKLGIKHDYSLLFPSKCGFKTGLAQPYPWFDLNQNRTTNLILHPSIVMEGTLRDYEKLSPEQALICISNLIEQTKNYGGEFISVWHNDSFSNENSQWKAVYSNMLNLL